MVLMCRLLSCQLVDRRSPLIVSTPELERPPLLLAEVSKLWACTKRDHHSDDDHPVSCNGFDEIRDSPPVLRGAAYGLGVHAAPSKCRRFPRRPTAQTSLAPVPPMSSRPAVAGSVDAVQALPSKVQDGGDAPIEQ
jgi:hypothetical protein